MSQGEGGSAAASLEPGAPRSFWTSVKDSLQGSRHDFTQTPLPRAVLLLSVPMVLENVLESVFSVVDLFFVARLGSEAVATVGLTEAMLMLVYAVASGLSMGASAIVSRRIGEKNADQAARAAVQAIALAVLVGVPLSVAGAYFARPLLALMGGSPWVLEQGVAFTQVLLGSLVIIFLLYLINAIFRGAGDVAIAMRVLWLANAINLVLAPCLIFGLGPFPAMGVAGAAVATVIGRSSGVLYQLYRLGQGHGNLRVRREHLRVDVGTMMTMVRLSGMGMFQAFVGTTSWLVLARIIASFGTAATAGYTVAMRIMFFVLLPTWALSGAAATLVGQNLGANRPERSEQAVWIVARYNTFFLYSVGALFLVAAEPIVGTFTSDPEAVANAALCLRVASGSFLFHSFGMVVVQAFNGAGDTMTPTFINIGCFWAVQLPLAWFLSGPMGLGPLGAYLALAIGFSLAAVVSLVLFRGGSWKLRKV